MKKLILFTILLLVSVSAHAVTLNSLYDISVLVDSQSETERKRAMNQAFIDLLVKVTGVPDIAQYEQAKPLIKNSKNYVRSFRYQAKGNDVIEESIKLWPIEQVSAPIEQNQVAEPEPSNEQLLVVSFDETEVGNALWQAKLPVWGKTRPTTLMWIAFQDSEKRSLLDASKKNELQIYLTQQAKKRGVPILFPKLDTEDQQNINVTDVWGGFKEPLEVASARYAAEVVASAQLVLEKDNHWEMRWSLIQGGEVEVWRVTAPDVNQAIESGMDGLAARIAKHFVTVAATADDSLLVYISDISNVFDYNRVSKYLNGLAPVKNAELVQVQANEVVFRLDLRSNVKQLKQAIALGKTLASHDPFGIESQDTRMSYQLIP